MYILLYEKGHGVIDYELIHDKIGKMKSIDKGQWFGTNLKELVDYLIYEHTLTNHVIAYELKEEY